MPTFIHWNYRVFPSSEQQQQQKIRKKKYRIEMALECELLP